MIHDFVSHGGLLTWTLSGYLSVNRKIAVIFKISFTYYFLKKLLVAPFTWDLSSPTRGMSNPHSLHWKVGS